MKCICGYEHGYVNVDDPENGLTCEKIEGEYGGFLSIEVRTTKSDEQCDIKADRPVYHYGTTVVYMYACPKCGTVKIDLPV